MAYFPNAFEQTLIMTGGLATSGKPSTLTAGSCGFYNAKTWDAVPLAQASVAQHPKVVFAAGSHRIAASDTLGSHGGYKESLKSRVIDPNYIHRVWKVAASTLQFHSVKSGWDGIDDGTKPEFYCGKTYHLHIDVTGSPALRLVGHNIYHTFEVKTSCCSGSGTDQQLVDSVQVLLAFAKQINESPLVSKFLTASVANGGAGVDSNTYVPETAPGAIASLQATLYLTAGYSDTQFNHFTFDPHDHYELEPVVISSVQLVDDSGDPCSLIKQLKFTDWQLPRSVKGSGANMLREFILTNEYRQDPFHGDARRKAINNFAGSLLVSPTAVYRSLYILYSTPRAYNPAGTYDNDLCLLHICTTTTTLQTNLQNWLSAYLISAGTGVVVEDMM